MAQQNDQVFQLSLTEIAFTIAFILLLLLGRLVFKEQTERKAAEAELSKVQSVERKTDELKVVRDQLETILQKAGVTNIDEIITNLVAAEDARAERDRLKKRVDALDAKLTALTELRNLIEKTVQANKQDVTLEEIESALALQEQVKLSFDQKDSTVPSAPILEQVKLAIVTYQELKKQLKSLMGKDLSQGQEMQTVHDVLAAAKSYDAMLQNGDSPKIIKKENADLRGQIAFLKNKLEARGGRDYPPCWADEKTGKVEFLFSVELKPDNVIVASAWPASRESDARMLPGLTEILTGNPHSNNNFVSLIQGIFNKSQELQCRHYVLLKSFINDAILSDRARLMVENYFYKVEVRR